MAKKSVFAYSTVDGVFQVLDRRTGTKKEDWKIVRSYDANEYPETIREKIFEYGHKQKIVDSASEGESPDDRLRLMDECHDNLMADKWASEREGGARVVSAEVEALARIKNASIAAIQKALASKTEDQRKKILASEKVKQMADTIRKEREEAEGLDFDDLDDEGDITMGGEQ